MTEYWQSKKQYWCKYCSIFIRDDAPSRAQHENGLRHQGNKERFLRDIYKTGERAIKEKEEEKRMMERIEKAANEAHAAATGSSLSSSFIAAPTKSTSPAPIASSSKPTPKPAPKSSDPYANYSSAASLGFVDAEEIAAAKAAEEREKRSKVGNVGGWETVAVSNPTPPPGAGDGEAGEEDERYALKEDSSDRYRHRNAINALQGSLGTDEAEEARSFSLTAEASKKRSGVRTVDDDDDWDPEAALKAMKPKVREETIMQRKEREEREALEAEEKRLKGGLDRGSWKGLVVGKDGVKREVTLKEEEAQSEAIDAKPEVKVSPADNTLPGQSTSAADNGALEDDEGEAKPKAGGAMFRKRKGGGAAGRSVRQKTA